ncbi:KRP95, partial [Symbiodinium sp. KB8]
LQVTICTLAGSTAAELQVKSSDTVLSLKQLLWARTGTEVAKQRLILEETELEDVQTMEQCKVADGAKLCLVCVPTAEDQQNKMEVIVRCRPPRARDVEIGSRRVVEMDGPRGEVSVADVGDGPPRTFTFQAVLDDTAKQSEVYKMVGRDALQTVLEGYSTTIFAYGQSGSGKSHTLFGSGLSEPAQEEEGLAPRLFRQLFQITETLPAMQWRISCAMLQIYMEDLVDLLSPNPRERKKVRDVPRRGGICVEEGTDVEVRSLAELDEVLKIGFAKEAELPRRGPSKKDRIVALTVRSQDLGGQVLTRKLQFVECRGSEKLSKVGVTSDALREQAQISRNSLGTVLEALASARPVVPYRDGKLTRLLADSLGGQTRTIWIAQVLPGSHEHSETLSTLRLANRVKQIVNKPLAVRPEPPDPLPCVPFSDATWLGL